VHPSQLQQLVHDRQTELQGLAAGRRTKSDRRQRNRATFGATVGLLLVRVGQRLVGPDGQAAGRPMATTMHHGHQ
jgi:hypothetical protein